jgi:hypothetical protein
MVEEESGPALLDTDRGRSCVCHAAAGASM